MQIKRRREGLAFAPAKRPEMRWEAQVGQNYATTVAAIWKSGEAATATIARAARTNVADSRIEGRVVVIGVSPGARASVDFMYHHPLE